MPGPEGRRDLLRRRRDVQHHGALDGRAPQDPRDVRHARQRGYRILKLNMVEYLGKAARGRKFVGMDLTDPDLRFDQMAEAMGVPAVRVEQPEDLAGASGRPWATRTAHSWSM